MATSIEVENSGKYQLQTQTQTKSQLGSLGTSSHLGTLGVAWSSQPFWEIQDTGAGQVAPWALPAWLQRWYYSHRIRCGLGATWDLIFLIWTSWVPGRQCWGSQYPSCKCTQLILIKAQLMDLEQFHCTSLSCDFSNDEVSRMMGCDHRLASGLKSANICEVTFWVIKNFINVSYGWVAVPWLVCLKKNHVVTFWWL